MTERDWKGDLVPYWRALFGQSIRITIPAELAGEAALLAYLGVGTTKLRKIRYYRARMYQHFSVAKGSNKVRMISAPDERLKFLQRRLAEKLTELYRPRKPVHGFVADRSIKTNALAHPASSLRYQYRSSRSSSQRSRKTGSRACYHHSGFILALPKSSRGSAATTGISPRGRRAARCSQT